MCARKPFPIIGLYETTLSRGVTSLRRIRRHCAGSDSLNLETKPYYELAMAAEHTSRPLRERRDVRHRPVPERRIRRN